MLDVSSLEWSSMVDLQRVRTTTTEYGERSEADVITPYGSDPPTRSTSYTRRIALDYDSSGRRVGT
jgi:hypothetical protein